MSAPKIIAVSDRSGLAPDQFYWQAYYDDDEPDDHGNMPHSFGETKELAIANLLLDHPRDGD